MFSLGQFNVASFLAPANPLIIYGVDQHFQYIRLSNNSPYQLSVNFGGIVINLGEFRVKDMEVPSWFQGTLTITPTINISTVSHAQSNSLIIEGYYKGEVDSPVDQAIPQQAVTATASGKPIFSASINFSSTATILQHLNVFNPPNSGVNFTFHAARAITTDASGASEMALVFLSGGDLNLPIPVAARSHDQGPNPPVSFAHCTAEDSAAGHGGNAFELIPLQQFVVSELISFPDTYILEPGNNLRIQLASNVGKNVSLILKWSEDIAVAPQGGVLTGVVMTSIVNTGNPAPTPVVTAAPGSEATATLINNDGSASLGSPTRSGTIKLADAASGGAQPALSANGSGAINLAALLSTQQIGLFVGATKVGHLDSGGIHLEAGAFQFDGSSSTLTTLILKLKTGGLTAINIFGPIAMTTAVTTYNHNLGVVPDIILLQPTGALAGANRTTEYDTSSLTTTQFNANGNASFSAMGIAIKL